MVARVMTRHHTNGDRESWYEAVRARRPGDVRYYDYDKVIAKYANRHSADRRE